MSLWKAYQGLSSKARLGLGMGFLAWGVAGLYLSDRVEEKFGYTPSEQNKADLEKMKPIIHVVDRDERQ